MANINELLARAAALRDETQLNSISPERAGGIMYETLLALNELWLQQGAALVISKIYDSVAAMNADTSPVSDLTGKPIRPGMVVVIASSDSDNGSVYRYNGTSSPSWSLVGEIGNLEPVDSLDSDSTSLPLAAHQGKVLDGKISQLGQEVKEKYGDYEENPEYIKVVTDSEDKILYGVKKDGDFYFGKGVPGQIKEAANTALSAKVDKVPGKSLVDSTFADSQGSIESPEFLQLVTDSEDKILEGIKTTGTKVVNIPVQNPVTTEDYIVNPEWKEVTIDEEKRIVKGLKKDGTQYNFKQESTTLDAIKKNLNYLNYYQHIYPHGAIVSFIDDDTGINAPEIWGRIINATGIRMGFACVAGFMSGEVPVPSGMEMLTPMTMAQLQAFYDAGNEVYSHSWTHPSFHDTNDLEVISEQCRLSRDWLLANGFIRNADVIVYPGGMGTEETAKQAVVRRYFKYGVDTYRTFNDDGLGQGINPEPFINDLAIIRCNGDTLTLDELKGRVDVARQHNRLLVVMNHAYELNTDKENQIAKLISFIQYIQGLGVQIMPLEEAIRYIYGWH